MALTSKKALRAIIYVRVSSYDTRAEDAANTSPDVQRTRCLARATAEGWTLADVPSNLPDQPAGIIFDLDVSGSDRGDRLDRPGLRIVRDAIRNRRADVVVSLRLDRLARNTVDLLTLAEELERHGGAFALAEGDINTAGPYGKLILTIIAAIAEMEAKIITARTMAGKIAAREEGRWIGTRRPPLGYVKAPHPTIKDGWTLALDPALTGTVRTAADMLAAPDGSLLKVARWLTAQGVPTATGAGTWRPAVVWAAFTNEIMIGRHYWQGDVLRDDAGMPVASFPALLPEATWRAIRQRYGVPKRRTKQRDGWERPEGTAPTGRPPALYLLSGGIARCGNCDGPLTVAPDSQGRKRYRCDRRGKGTCSRGVSIRVADLDAIVTERFLALAGNLYAADVQEVTTAPDAARRADLADAIRRAERAMSAADDADDETAFAAARALRRSLRAELDALPTAAVTTRQRVISTSTYAERWAALDGDTDARRELLRPLVTVTVAPATERTATGHFNNSPAALARRVRMGWADELESAAIDALENAAIDALEDEPVS